MGNRVKCQHCWKVFEVPDHALNKQQKCVFCQRMTVVQPVDSKKDKATRQMRNVLEESVEKEESTQWNVVVICLLTLTLANLSLTCYLGFSDTGEAAQKNASREAEKRLEEIETQLTGLKNQITQCHGALEKLEENIEPSDEITDTLILEVGSSINLITHDLDAIWKEIENLPKKEQ